MIQLSRLRLGSPDFLPRGQKGGVNVGWEDVFIGRTGLTVSGEYQAAFNRKRPVWSRPALLCASFGQLCQRRGGGRLSASRNEPVLNGWRNLGARLLLVLSRGGAADISLTQKVCFPVGMMRLV